MSNTLVSLIMPSFGDMDRSFVSCNIKPHPSIQSPAPPRTPDHNAAMPCWCRSMQKFSAPLGGYSRVLIMGFSLKFPLSCPIPENLSKCAIAFSTKLKKSVGPLWQSWYVGHVRNKHVFKRGPTFQKCNMPHTVGLRSSRLCVSV